MNHREDCRQSDKRVQELGLIVVTLGAPGTGKTTIQHALSARLECPAFELSWMPEFLVRNGERIAYEEDEAIAVDALIQVAKTYLRHGHRYVLLSDFRLATLDAIRDMLADVPHRFVVLHNADEALLTSRVLDESRSSGYRDTAEALALNARYPRLELPNAIRIDTGRASVEDAVEIILKHLQVAQNELGRMHSD